MLPDKTETIHETTRIKHEQNHATRASSDFSGNAPLDRGCFDKAHYLWANLSEGQLTESAATE
jgi:hypothetical protein